LEYGLKPVLSALGARHILAGVYATDRQVHFDQAGGVHIDADVRDRLDEAATRLLGHIPFAAHPPAVDLGRLVSGGRLSV